MNTMSDDMINEVATHMRTVRDKPECREVMALSAKLQLTPDFRCRIEGDRLVCEVVWTF